MNNERQSGDVDPKGAKNETDGVLPPFSNYEDKDMEWWLWVTYLSGAFWIVGWVVMLPLGIGIYSYLAWISLVTFIDMVEGKEGDFSSWFVGPFARAWVTGPIYFLCAWIFSSVPVMGAVTSFFFGYLANLDYYSYYYNLFGGPTFPQPWDWDLDSGDDPKEKVEGCLWVNTDAFVADSFSIGRVDSLKACYDKVLAECSNGWDVA
jgi:hypothetical protein